MLLSQTCISDYFSHIHSDWFLNNRISILSNHHVLKEWRKIEKSRIFTITKVANSVLVDGREHSVCSGAFSGCPIAILVESNLTYFIIIDSLVFP